MGKKTGNRMSKKMAALVRAMAGLGRLGPIRYRNILGAHTWSVEGTYGHDAICVYANGDVVAEVYRRTSGFDKSWRLNNEGEWEYAGAAEGYNSIPPHWVRGE